MALKNWKKALGDKYQITFRNKIENIDLYINKTASNTWVVQYFDNYKKNWNRPYANRYFKTKSQALKFAKQYMRTH